MEPTNLDEVEVGDIVFCKVKGRYYTHLVKAKGDRGVLIGNNHGKINGWQANVEFVREGGTIMYTNINAAMPLSQVENVLHEYERQRAPRIISLDSGYGQLCPLVKRCDYERVLSEVSH